MTEEQLAALLRLKRFEQPPAGYYDRLLHDVHRRQRAELLRRPLWRIALERVQAFFSERHAGDLSPAGALATVMALAAGTMVVLTPGLFQPLSGSRMIASRPSAPSVESTPSPRPTAALPPRYVIDALPVSYEPTVSF